MKPGTLPIIAAVDFRSISFGQFISCLTAGGGIAAASLSDRDLDFPLLLSFIVYLFLMLYLIKVKLPLKVPLWKYAIYSILDIEANFFILYSFRYTSITSVMLIDCFSIPSAMILSKYYFGTLYSLSHFVGVLLCVVGVVVTVINDLDNGSMVDGHSFSGDIMALIGAVLFGCANVMQEAIVKKHDRNEFLGMVGLFGTLFCGLQLCIFEMEDIIYADFTWDAIGYFTLYVVCTLTMYSWTSIFLQQADSALFNLSLLTSDAYGALFAYFIEGHSFTSYYYLSFAVIVCGLLIYHGSPHALKTTSDSKYDCDEEVIKNSKILHEQEKCVQYKDMDLFSPKSLREMI